ncbi:MAG: alanine racemase, partial [Dyella sp.]|nr:alanine racemase [Dyella sp.]
MTDDSSDLAYLASNWANVRERVDAACHAAGRDPSEVTILPVSKTFGPDIVRAAMALGLRRFGENKVQEIRSKAEALAGEDIAWVVIGHLQTNKAKDVARLASEVQSLDRIELAEALHKRLQIEGRAIDVLVEVKTSSEE